MSLAEFLVMLANDPEALEEFKENPDGYLESVDLTPEQKQVLTAGRLVDIRYMVEADFKVAREGDAPAETTTVAFVRPVWFRPVWFRKKRRDDDEQDAEPLE